MVYMAGLRAPRMFPALFRIYGFHYCWLVVVGYTGTTLGPPPRSGGEALSKLKLAARLHFMSKLLRAHKNPKSRTGHPYIQLVGHPPCPPRKVTSNHPLQPSV